MALPLLFVKRFPFAAPVATVLIGIGISDRDDREGDHGRRSSRSSCSTSPRGSSAGSTAARRSSGSLLVYTAVIVVDTQADELTAARCRLPVVPVHALLGSERLRHGPRGTGAGGGGAGARLAVDQETASLRAVAEERQRIARELHDVIAHSVSVMTVQAGAVRRLLLPEQERERQALETVESTGREALTEMRRLVGLLREQGAMPEFTPQPSLRTIDILIGTVREAGLDVELEIQGDERELPPGVDLSAYRLVQEALTNTLKYAGPARAWVTLRWRDDGAGARGRERRALRAVVERLRPWPRRHA